LDYYRCSLLRLLFAHLPLPTVTAARVLRLDSYLRCRSFVAGCCHAPHACFRYAPTPRLFFAFTRCFRYVPVATCRVFVLPLPRLYYYTLPFTTIDFLPFRYVYVTFLHCPFPAVTALLFCLPVLPRLYCYRYFTFGLHIRLTPAVYRHPRCSHCTVVAYFTVPHVTVLTVDYYRCWFTFTFTHADVRTVVT